MGQLKLGVFGVRADSRGLHYQTQAFCRWLQPERSFGIDMTADDLSPYPCVWPNDPTLTIMRYSEIDEGYVRRWLRGLDVVLGAETFYKDEFVIWAREEGVRTVLHCNREFTPWVSQPDRFQVPAAAFRPDVLAMPTPWLIESIPDAVHLPLPVDRAEFPFRLRTNARRFVHVAGHKAMSDRAGTRIVYGAVSRLRDTDAEVIIKSQSPLNMGPRRGTPVVVVEGNVSDPRELYEDADVVLLPRRYGGCSLVHQEALSVGCPVISLDRLPENTWGGVLCLPSTSRQKMRTKGGLIPVHDAHPSHLGQVIRELANDDGRVEKLSHEANAFAKSISWDVLLPRYMDLFKSLV